MVQERTPDVAAELAERYGRSRSTRQRCTARLVAVVGAGVAVTVFGWTALNYSSREVRWLNISYDVVDPSRVSVTFEVYADAGSAARCVVRAVDGDGADVGQVELDVRGIEQPGARRTVEIETLRPASGASVRTCVPLPGGVQ